MRSDTPKTHGRGTFSPFAYPAFRAIWAANLLSNLGSMVQAVGAAWLMTDLTHSYRLVALVQSSNVAPTLLLAVFAGAIADNFDRRRVMVVAQVIMLASSALLAALAWQHAITPALLLVLTLAVGAGTALNQPSWQASVRFQVGSEVLPQAITLNAMGFNIARCVGPALGGLLIALFSVGWAFVFNALSYVGLLLTLHWWRPQVPERTYRPIRSTIAEGLRYFFGSPPLVALLARGLVFGFGISAFQALLPMIVRNKLGGGEVDLGLLLGMFGVGSVAAGLLLHSLRRLLGGEGLVTAATLLFVASHLTMAYASGLVMASLGAVFAGSGYVLAMTTLNVLVQTCAPEPLLGRCISIYQAGAFGCMAVGAWLWGAIADFQGLETSLFCAAAFLAVTLAGFRLSGGLPAATGRPAG